MKITTEATSTEESQKPKSTRKPLYDTTLLQVTSPRNGTRLAQPPGADTGAPKTAIPSSRMSLIPTVFHEDWWMEAATEGRHTTLEVSANNQTVGRLPFMMRNRLGLKGIWTPPFTYFLGPGIDEGEGSANTRYLRRLEITRELIHKLPPSSWQCIRCHGGTPDVIPFQEQTFRTYVQFTYEVPPASEKEIWQRMRDKTRNVIRRAEEQFETVEIPDANAFIRLYENNLSSKSVRNKLDLSACKRLIEAALQHDQGRVIAARNRTGEIVAANFCAWDHKTSYYISCTRSDAAGNGAASMLVWQAIQHAANKGLIFDFAGLGTSGSILHYTGFGGVISPRFAAVRSTRLGRVIAGVRSLLTEDHFFF